MAQKILLDPDKEVTEEMQPEAEKLLRMQKVWLKRIEYENESHKKFRKRAREVNEIFRNDMPGNDKLHVPLYWTVVNVQHAGVYSNQPSPDVRPSNENMVEEYAQVAMLLDRGCRAIVDGNGFDFNAHRAVDDYLAISLGVMRAKIDTEMVDEAITSQVIRWEYVPASRFIWEPCCNESQMGWAGVKHAMTPRYIRKRFGRDVKATQTDVKKKKKGHGYSDNLLDVYEIWDKEKRMVLFIAEGETEPLEVIEDPFELSNFYPFVVMWGNLAADELVPVPDYDFLEPYDTELNRLQKRRMEILEQIRAAGAFDSSFDELKAMLEQGDGEYRGIKGLAQRLKAMGGVDSAIYHLPLKEKSVVLQQLTEQITFVKAQVDDIMGISDIVRGVTTASESATAQEIKGRWVGVRLSRKREVVQYAMRDVMRINAQLLANVITPEALLKMTQIPITQQMFQLLQDKTATHFAIDVETESTVAKDEFEERRVHQEMLNGVGQYATAIAPTVQQGLMPADVSSAVLRAALTPYAKYDKNLATALMALPNTQQQLQGLQQQNGQMMQQLQQSQMQLQQVSAELQYLKDQATQAKSQQQIADAEKKSAEANEINAGLQDERLQAAKTVAEIEQIRANTRAVGSGR